MVTRNALITLMATGTTTLAAYVFQTAMARLLSTLEYGELSSIVATLNIVTIPMLGLSMVITRDVAARKSGDPEQLGLLIQPYVLRIATITMALVIGLLLVSPWLTGFLQLSSIVPLVFLAVLVTLTNIVGMGRAVLLGLHDFASVALNQVVEGLIRLLSAIAIAASGLIGSAGFGGYSAGLFAALVLVASRLPSSARVLLSVRRPWRHKTEHNAVEIHSRDRDISWSAIVVTGTFIVLLNMDLVVVKHFLPPGEAGQYAAMSTLARVLFVITNAFDVVLFPAAAAARAAAGEGLAHLRRAVFGVSAIIIPILAVYWLVPTPLLNLVFGPRYLEVAPLLAPYGVAITLLGISTLLARYRIAVGRGIPSAALLAVVAIAAVGFLAFHGDLAQIVGVLLLTSVVALGLASAGPAVRVSRRSY